MLKRVFTSMGAILSGQALTFLGNLLLVPLFSRTGPRRLMESGWLFPRSSPILMRRTSA
jgi:hypothetical protein